MGTGRKIQNFLEKSENHVFSKKFFFLRSDIQGVSGGPPGEGIKNFHPPMGGEMIKTLTLINLASKFFFTI